jgi:endogenous inhibitor of DNA gyrase (YacG/DUF329 family)
VHQQCDAIDLPRWLSLDGKRHAEDSTTHEGGEGSPIEHRQTS